MNKDIAALKEEIEKYVAGVEAYRQSVKEAVAKAVAQHDADCSADIKSLQNEVKAAEEKMAPPPFEASNQ